MPRPPISFAHVELSGARIPSGYTFITTSYRGFAKINNAKLLPRIITLY